MIPMWHLMNMIHCWEVVVVMTSSDITITATHVGTTDPTHYNIIIRDTHLCHVTKWPRVHAQTRIICMKCVLIDSKFIMSTLWFQYITCTWVKFWKMNHFLWDTSMITIILDKMFLLCFSISFSKVNKFTVYTETISQEYRKKILYVLH